MLTAFSYMCSFALLVRWHSPATWASALELSSPLLFPQRPDNGNNSNNIAKHHCLWHTWPLTETSRKPSPVDGYTIPRVSLNVVWLLEQAHLFCLTQALLRRTGKKYHKVKGESHQHLKFALSKPTMCGKVLFKFLIAYVLSHD